MKEFLSENNLINVSKLLLRYGMATVFLWFGFSQLQNPVPWTTFLPSWVSMMPISESNFVMLNGLFEVVAATLLLIGAYVRVSAFLLGLHLLGIALSIGITSTGVRDFGLTIASFALAGLGAGKFSVDELSEQNPEKLNNFKAVL